MTTATGRPRKFDEEEVLARILELFRTHGYENTTLEQLVAESGLSKSSLYNAFGGKDAFHRFRVGGVGRQSIHGFRGHSHQRSLL